MAKLPDPSKVCKTEYKLSNSMVFEEICKLRSYDIRGDIPIPICSVGSFNNSSYTYSSKIKELDDSSYNNWIELVKWCKTKSIKLNVSGYQDDESLEFKSLNFPYITKSCNLKNKVKSNIINDKLMEQMTSMDPSGHMDWSKFEESVPEIFSDLAAVLKLNSVNKVNIDMLESNDLNSNSFAPC